MLDRVIKHYKRWKEKAKRERKSHQYSKLRDPGQIRILYLEPGKRDEPLRGKIEHVDLDKADFIAFSYVWGNPEKMFQMLVEGRDKKVTKIPLTESLHTLLRDMRNPDWRVDSLKGKSNLKNRRAFWVDQICINQDDNSEKSHQVTLMGKIYRRASEVITYIGPEGPTSPRAVEILLDLHHLSKTIDHPSTWSTGLSEAEIARHFRLEGRETEGWDSLDSILDREWPDRIWILQENVLNRRQLLACGSTIIMWDCIYILAKLILGVAVVEQSLGFGSVDKCIKINRMAGIRDRLEAKSVIPLLELLVKSGRLLCADPRDKVFGVLGMASDTQALGIDLDYEKETLEIYQDVARNIIRVHKSLDILSFVGPARTEGPSWIPDWSEPTTFFWEQIYGHMATGSMEANFIFEKEGTVLAVEGIFIDEIVDDAGMWDLFAPGCSLKSDSPSAKVLQNACKKLNLTLDELSDEDYIRVATVITERTGISAPYVAGEGVIKAFKAWTQNEFTSQWGTYVNDPYHPWHEEMMKFRNSVVLSCGKHLGVTEQKRMVTSRAKTKAGDKIAILFGGRTGYILRPVGDDEYELISDAYVENFMNGEGLENKSLMDKAQMIRIV